MIYYEMAYQFLLDHPNTSFNKLPLEILTIIMKFLNKTKFQWNHHKNAKDVLNYHYQNLIPKNYERLTIMEWKTDWVTHNLPQFVVTLDTEFLNNNCLYVKELNIRRKRATKQGFWNMKSRVMENVENLNNNPYFKTAISKNGKTEFVWKQMDWMSYQRNLII